MISLAPRAQAHDFAATTTPLYHQLYSRALQLTRKANEAQDLVQETYLRTLEQWDRFDCLPDRHPCDIAGAWMFRILTNVFLSEKRAETRHADLYAEHTDAILFATTGNVGSGVCGDVAVERGETHVHGEKSCQITSYGAIAETVPTEYISVGVRQALDSLGQAARAVVVRADILEMTHAEIAEELEIEIGTVKSRLFRAHAKLAEELADESPHKPLPAPYRKESV